MLKKMTTLEATFVVLMSACGIALKPIVGPMAKLVGSALFIPSGAIAGAVYMIWPMMALLVVGRFGTAMLVGLIEGIVVLVTGLYGSHGFLSLLIYFMPCLLMDLSFLLVRSRNRKWMYFLPTALANVTGTALVGLLIMHMPRIPLMLSLIPSLLFGGLGGLFAVGLHGLLVRSFPQLGRED